MIKEKLQEDLTQALKAHEHTVVSVLRFVLAAIKNKEIEKKDTITDEECTAVLRKQIKELTDAKELFAKGGRIDLVAQNESQIAILQKYMPAELSDEALKQEVLSLIANNTAAISQNPKSIIGIVMKSLSSKARPDRIMKMLQEVQNGQTPA